MWLKAQKVQVDGHLFNRGVCKPDYLEIFWFFFLPVLKIGITVVKQIYLPRVEPPLIDTGFKFTWSDRVKSWGTGHCKIRCCQDTFAELFTASKHQIKDSINTQCFHWLEDEKQLLGSHETDNQTRKYWQTYTLHQHVAVGLIKFGDTDQCKLRGKWFLISYGLTIPLLGSPSFLTMTRLHISLPSEKQNRTLYASSRSCWHILLLHLNLFSCRSNLNPARPDKVHWLLQILEEAPQLLPLPSPAPLWPRLVSAGAVSWAACTLQVLWKAHEKQFGFRVFSNWAPRIWNALPQTDRVY